MRLKAEHGEAVRLRSIALWPYQAWVTTFSSRDSQRRFWRCLSLWISRKKMISRFVGGSDSTWFNIHTLRREQRLLWMRRLKIIFTSVSELTSRELIPPSNSSSAYTRYKNINHKGVNGNCVTKIFLNEASGLRMSSSITSLICVAKISIHSSIRLNSFTLYRNFSANLSKILARIGKTFKKLSQQK